MRWHRAAYDTSNQALEPILAERALRAYWDRIVQEFDKKGYLEPGRARMEIDSAWHDSCRHYAAMDSNGSALFVAPEILDLPPENIFGVLGHEAGHLVDFANPGRYWFRPATAVVVRTGSKCVSVADVPPSTKQDVLFFFEKLPQKNLNKHMNEWHHRTKDETERLADAIASIVLEASIGYTGSSHCLIEAINKGISRPRGLR